MSANNKQIGGSHYKKGGEEHWDRQWRLYGRGYFVGCITKYVERYHEKNGVQDLQKAQHFLEKLIELENRAADDLCRAQVPNRGDFNPPLNDGEPTAGYVNQDR
jgi:hypothetical protein